MANMHTVLAHISPSDYQRLDVLATESGWPMSVLIDELMHTGITEAYVDRQGATRRVFLPACLVAQYTAEREVKQS